MKTIYNYLDMRKIFIIAGGIFFGTIASLYVISLRPSTSRIKNSIRSIHETISQKSLPTPTATPLPDFCITAPVLFYHHIQPFDKAEDQNQKNLTVTPENFAGHIRYLTQKGYTLVPIEKIVDSLLSRKNPGKVAAIVLDDGYVNNYTYAFPIAKRYSVPINVAMVTGFASSYNQLSWGQIKIMADSGLIYMLNHSWSHQSLHQDNKDTIFKQVTVAQEQLEKHIPNSRKIFIYPYGRVGETVINVLKDQQFDAAFTDKKGVEHCLSQRYTLPRLRTGNFSLTVHGL